jgi:NADH-quinone oxidoreductase subunit M
MEWFNSHVLSILTFLPLVVSALIFLIPGEKFAKVAAIAGSIITFFVSFHVWHYFDASSPKLQFVESYVWIPEFGIRAIFGVDGISLLLVMLTTALMPLVLLSLWSSHVKNLRQFLGLIMALETGMLGALVAMDLVFFYVFWEAMLIPMYFIIGIWGGARRIYATTKFILYTVVGSLLMLAAAIALYLNLYWQTGVYSTSMLDLYGVTLDPRTQMWMFGAFALAFAIKVPMWPFHTWLPDAHVEAPTAGSVILAGVLLKMGTYGFLRFAIPLFPLALQSFAPVLIFLGIVGIIYGALTAWVQKDAKKLVAYSSVSHLGFVVLGSVAILADGTLSSEALTGAIYQMINHGVSTGALFLLVGVIYERRHTRMLADFGGLASVMPWFAVMLIVATLGSVGLPGTGGFVGEFLILLGTFQASPAAGLLAATGVLLGAVYMLTLCRQILFGPVKHEENKSLKDLSPLEFAYLAPLAILVIVMGIFPDFFLNKSRASIDHLARNYANYRIGVDSH